MAEPISNLLFLFQRLDGFGILDIALVTLLFVAVFLLFRGTQAAIVLRGVAILIAGVALLTNLSQLPAFSWLLRSLLPALVVTIPVVFGPEIRRPVERVGRADFFRRTSPLGELPPAQQAVVTAAMRLSERRHGALIVLEREVGLEDFASTGVRMEANVTPELLLQIFYPNTPLHDGAVILRGDRILAAGCVVPLSSSDTTSPSPERRMGLRHRAALGVSEVSDAVAVVVSEETGIVSVAHSGRIIRRLDGTRLQNILSAFSRGSMRRTAWNLRPWVRTPEKRQEAATTREGRISG
jgi:diadenylate cyclase